MWWIVFVLIVVFVWLVAGFRIVKQQERWIIELFGRYYQTLKPGLNWILPGIMKVRAIVPTWELPLPLFEKSIKIDFKDGSATPKGAVVFVKMKKPDTRYGNTDGEKETGACRAIYEIANWKVATRDLIENALRSCLNGLTIDEAITMARAGYDLATADPNSGLPNHELKRIKGVLSGWGFELRRITITDFDLELELVAARGKVQIRRREAEAAEHVRLRRGRETSGALIQMMAESTGKTFEETQREVDTNPALREKLRAFAEELVTRQMSIDGKALIDIRTAGGGDLEQVLLRLIAALNILPKGERHD